MIEAIFICLTGEATVSRPEGVLQTHGDAGASISFHGMAVATVLGGHVSWVNTDAPRSALDYVAHVQREQYRRMLDFADGAD